jgi:hypothetical protein
MWFFTKQNKIFHSGWDFTSVFLDKDFARSYNTELLEVTDDDLTADEHKFLDDVIFYFEEQVLNKKLNGDDLSEWEESLGNYIGLAKLHQCWDNNLTMFVKLPVFFLEQEDLSGVLNQYKNNHNSIDDKEVRLTLVKNVPHNASRSKNKHRIFFKDTDENLFVWQPKKAVYMPQMLKLWKDYIPVQISTRTTQISDKVLQKIEEFVINL